MARFAADWPWTSVVGRATAAIDLNFHFEGIHAENRSRENFCQHRSPKIGKIRCALEALTCSSARVRENGQISAVRVISLGARVVSGDAQVISPDAQMWISSAALNPGEIRLNCGPAPEGLKSGFVDHRDTILAFSRGDIVRPTPLVIPKHCPSLPACTDKQNEFGA
jgi:hypothetical protein